jgi:hypothetical protein
MGRVARYKKVKSFDPYSSKNGGRIDLDTVGVWGLGDMGRRAKKRSRTAENLRRKRKKAKSDGGFDIEPASGDDFDLADLVGSVKREANPARDLSADNKPVVVSSAVGNKSTKRPAVPASLHTPGASSPMADEEQKVAAKMMKQLESQVEQNAVSKNSLQQHQPEGRMPGESKNAYRRRVKRETRQILQRERMQARNPEKLRRKKDFLNNKKKKKSGKKTWEPEDGDTSSAYQYTGQNGGTDRGLTVEQKLEERARETEVRFGEQAERPPVFKQLPRGAKAKKQKATTTGKMSETAVLAEQEAMEAVRQKVQAQYALIKAKRKQAGDFHL